MKDYNSIQSEAEIERLLGPSRIKLTVYLKDDGMYEEDIGADACDDRVAEIMSEGLEIETDRPGEMIYYPPHSILKVVTVNPEMEGE